MSHIDPARLARVRSLVRSGEQTPFLLVDPAAARAAMEGLSRDLPGVSPHYAVKANPSPGILRMLAGMEGTGVDAASPAEIDMALRAGFAPARVTYGNTLRREADTAKARSAGVSLFALDSAGEVARTARAAPGASFYLRLAVPQGASEWPLARKFGCDPEEAPELVEQAVRAGLSYEGLSFHVGSQQLDPSSYARALEVAARADGLVRERTGLTARLVNVGGGFPVPMRGEVPPLRAFGEAIRRSLDRLFPEARAMCEPGRAVAAPAGLLVCRVLATATRAGERWAYLDVGRFGGLAETEGESIRYAPVNLDRGGPEQDFVLAGPTCDGADVLYVRNPVRLPAGTEDGDLVAFPMAGAYTTVYAAAAFNGMPGLRAVEEEGGDCDELAA